MATKALAISNPSKHVPDKYEGELEPNYYCRAWNSKRNKYCKSTAGCRTTHKGQGRCWVHGGTKAGDPRMRHGFYSEVSRKRVAELMEMASERDPRDMVHEINLLRALSRDYAERYTELRDALLSWNEVEAQQAIAAKKKPFPQRIPDIAEVSQVVERTARVSDMLVRQEQADAVSLKDFLRLMAEMARSVSHALDKHVRDSDVAASVLEDVNEAWQNIRL